MVAHQLSGVLQARPVLLPSGWGSVDRPADLGPLASGHEAEASGMAPWAWLGTQPCGQCPETAWVVQGSGRKCSHGQA